MLNTFTILMLYNSIERLVKEYPALFLAYKLPQVGMKSLTNFSLLLTPFSPKWSQMNKSDSSRRQLVLFMILFTKVISLLWRIISKQQIIPRGFIMVKVIKTWKTWQIGEGRNNDYLRSVPNCRPRYCAIIYKVFSGNWHKLFA